MAFKRSYSTWKRSVEAMQPSDYRNLKEAYKAFDKLYNGFLTVEGSQDKEQNTAMRDALTRLHKRITTHFQISTVHDIYNALPNP
jgi:hypothetical protein